MSKKKEHFVEPSCQFEKLPGKPPAYVYDRPDYTPDAYALILDLADFDGIKSKWKRTEGKGMCREITLSLPGDIDREKRDKLAQRMEGAMHIAHGLLRGERLQQTNQHGRSWRTSMENGVRFVQSKWRDMEGRHAEILSQDGKGLSDQHEKGEKPTNKAVINNIRERLMWGEEVVLRTTQRELHRAQQEVDDILRASRGQRR